MQEGPFIKDEGVFLLLYTNGTNFTSGSTYLPTLAAYNP
jgi:hypothetical protein